jgi:hypothetical protein
VTDAASGERGVAVAVTFDAVVDVRDDAGASCVVRATSIRKHGKRERVRRATSNFEVVSSVRPIQMFRVSPIAAKPTRQTHEKKKTKRSKNKMPYKRSLKKHRKRAFAVRFQ